MEIFRGGDYWAKSLPYFIQSEYGEFIERGNIADNAPHFELYRTLANLEIMKATHVNLPVPSDEHIKFTGDMIIAAQEEYQKKFTGPFYVLIHPMSGGDSLDKLAIYLQDNNVNVIDNTIFSYDPEKSYTSVNNPTHPGPEINHILAEGLMNYLSF
jgi:hypothetical protein